MLKPMHANAAVPNLPNTVTLNTVSHVVVTPNHKIIFDTIL